jgi:hypothetical protein
MLIFFACALQASERAVTTRLADIAEELKMVVT